MTRLIQFFRRINWRSLWLIPCVLLLLSGCTSVVIKAQEGSHITIGGSVSNEAQKQHQINPSVPVSVVP